jgi:hypothetical protein
VVQRVRLWVRRCLLAIIRIPHAIHAMYIDMRGATVRRAGLFATTLLRRGLEVRRAFSDWLEAANASDCLRVFSRNHIYGQIAYRIRFRAGRFLAFVLCLAAPPLALCAIGETPGDGRGVAQVVIRLIAQRSSSGGRAVSIRPTDDRSASTRALHRLRLVTVSSRAERVSLLDDYGALAILLVLFPVHSMLFLSLWSRLGGCLAKLRSDGMIDIEERDYKEWVARYQSAFSSRASNLIAILGAIFITLCLFTESHGHKEWWGGISAPSLGIAAFSYASLFIWYQLLLHNIKGIVASRIALDILSSVLRPQLFHSDGAYGLRQVARFLSLAVGTTVIHSLAILALVFDGFLLVGTDPLFVILLVAFLLFVPWFFLFPAFAMRRQVSHARNEYLLEITRDLHRAFRLPRKPDSLPALLELQALLSIRESLDGLPRHPFPRFYIRMGALGYGLQVVSASITIWLLFHPSPAPAMTTPATGAAPKGVAVQEARASAPCSVVPGDPTAIGVSATPRRIRRFEGKVPKGRTPGHR